MHVLLFCLLGLQLASVSMAACEERPKNGVFRRFDVDLTTGATSDLPSGISWYKKLTSGVANKSCSRDGILELNFSYLDRRRRAQINLTFDQSVGWSFHLGDASVNNGYYAFYADSDHFTEVRSVNHSLVISDKKRPTQIRFEQAYTKEHFVGLPTSNHLTINVADQLLTIDNGKGFVYFRSSTKFALKGKSDKHGVKYNLYLGMNRVMKPYSFRTGTGLCKVSVQFHTKSL